jgi:hypothetical protein
VRYSSIVIERERVCVFLEREREIAGCFYKFELTSVANNVYSATDSLRKQSKASPRDDL